MGKFLNEWLLGGFFALLFAVIPTGNNLLIGFIVTFLIAYLLEVTLFKQFRNRKKK